MPRTILAPQLIAATMTSDYFDAGTSSIFSAQCTVTEAGSSTFSSVSFQLQRSNAVPPSDTAVGNGWDPPAASFVNVGSPYVVSSDATASGFVADNPTGGRWYRVVATTTGLSGTPTALAQVDMFARGPAR